MLDIIYVSLLLCHSTRVRINAAKLESFLRNNVYGGRSFWRLLESPILYGVLLLIVTLAARDWFVETARKERAGRSAMWAELLPESGRIEGLSSVGCNGLSGHEFSPLHCQKIF